MRLRWRRRPSVILWIVFSVLLLSTFLLLLWHEEAHDDQDGFAYGVDAPMIFVDGISKSAKGLMLAMLDIHPHITCRQDELSVPIVERGMPAPRLCFDDPNALKSGSYIKNTLPRAKFIFVVRDGRAAVHSLLQRDNDVQGIDCSVYLVCMIAWNRNVMAMYRECQALGEESCLIVHYEQLVLRPVETIKSVLGFLELPCPAAVQQHARNVQQQPNAAALSKLEYYSDRVLRPVYPDTLSSWVGSVPEKLKSDIASIAPMLAELGYDPQQHPPDYTKMKAKQVAFDSAYRKMEH